MSEGEERSRLRAWDEEMRTVHDRLREALHVAQEAATDGRDVPEATRELLLFCRGFCAALQGHHEAEDRALFPAVEAAHPELRDSLRSLTQDHSMMAHLIGGLDQAVRSGQPPENLARHLEGLAAIMESHFRYEERTLLTVLEHLDLDASREEALGPL